MVPAAALNGVFVDGPDVERAVVESLLDEVAATGLPYFLQTRPGCALPLAEIAFERKLDQDVDQPLMVLEGTASLDDASSADLRIRTLAPEDAELHADLAAAGFEAPNKIFRRLVTPATLGLSGMRGYVGVVEGRAVTTGLGLTIADSVGIFNIATPPAERRRGYGAAVTSHAVRDGLSDGARWAWLQASPSGYRVYERLGFRMIEAWQQWLTTS